MTALKKSRRKIRAIIYHCTATPPRRNVTYYDLRNWHVRDRKWSDIGYHYFIPRNGKFVLCRDVDRQGAHAAHGGWNRGTIGIALAGGLDSTLNPAPIYTQAQERTLWRIHNEMLELYPNARQMGAQRHRRG